MQQNLEVLGREGDLQLVEDFNILFSRLMETRYRKLIGVEKT